MGVEPVSTLPVSTDTDDVIEREEGFVSYGAPTCDVCRRMDFDDRPDGAEFWPDEPIHYVRGDERVAVEYDAAMLCPHHDTAEHRPDDATHRLRLSLKYVGDEPDRMNSAYRRSVVEAERLDD